MQVRTDIAYAIPFFLALIGVEARRRPSRCAAACYRLQDALADLGCGIAQQVALVFFALAAARALRARCTRGARSGSRRAAAGRG